MLKEIRNGNDQKVLSIRHKINHSGQENWPDVNTHCQKLMTRSMSSNQDILPHLLRLLFWYIYHIIGFRILRLISASSERSDALLIGFILAIYNYWPCFNNHYLQLRYSLTYLITIFVKTKCTCFNLGVILNMTLKYMIFLKINKIIEIKNCQF